MKKNIDCMLIGHNEMDFSEYEKNIGRMNLTSGAYRDLNLSFVKYKNKLYTVPLMLNLLSDRKDIKNKSIKKKMEEETFSATIAYLGSYLNRRGLTFDYINSFQNDKLELSEKLVNYNILTIAITTTLYVSIFPVLEIVDFIKKYNNTAKIIIGGPLIFSKTHSLSPLALDYMLKTIGADYYVSSSQGEMALINIINSLKMSIDINKVANIFYRSGDGYIRTNIIKEDNKLAENIVNWNLFVNKAKRYVNIRTSISCPFSCYFCAFPEHSGKYQTVNVELVEKELKVLSKIKELKSVYFIDDTFNIPIKRFKEILKMMIKNRFNFRWHCQFRVQFADEEIVKLMKESGCEGVYLGIESGSNEILKNMNKDVQIHQYYNGIKFLKRYEIPSMGSFIIGFPGETEETVKETIKFIKESKIDFYRTQLWYYDHITPIWRKRNQYNISGESFEWKHSTMDSKTAANLIDDIFLSIEEPIWVPQYNFDFDNLLHLFDRKLNLEQIKNFIRAFNFGIREKLNNRNNGEINDKYVEQMQKIIDVDIENDNKSS